MGGFILEEWVGRPSWLKRPCRWSIQEGAGVGHLGIRQPLQAVSGPLSRGASPSSPPPLSFFPAYFIITYFIYFS